MSEPFAHQLNAAWDRMQSGDSAGAQYLCREILRGAPGNPEALYLLGVIQLRAGLTKDAIRTFEDARAAAPADGPILESLGVAHLSAGAYAAAEEPLRAAAAIPGAPATVLMRLGFVLIHLERIEDAVAVLEQAVARDPRNPEALLNLGLALSQRGDLAAAGRSFQAALECAPDYPDALYNLAVLAMREHRYDAARQCFERLVTRAGDAASPDLLEGLAMANRGLGRNVEAVRCLRRVLERAPDRAGTLGALAQALFQLGELDEAATAAERAVTLDPLDPELYSTLADIHLIRNKLTQGTAVLEDGYAKTGALRLLATLRFEYRRQCDWAKWRPAWERLAQLLPAAEDAVSPFSLLCEDTTPAEQRRYAERWCASLYAAAADPAPAPARSKARLRIGYLSSDLHEHATAYLLAEVLERHDRTRFEIFAYSYGPEDKSAMRARLRDACEHFIDIAREPDDVAARRIREDRLDVLVDLKGHTFGARTAILAQRPCAVQVNWLGYPGTMGAPFVDYLIADAFVIPEGREADYRERIVRLPHCYQPNDRRRPVSTPRARAAYGLPEDGVVFCCFNQGYKISPDLFACWMRLLAAVPGAVLWLLEDNALAVQNLRATAQAAGIDPARIVFAPKLPLGEHLARYRVADLALDTFPYTSHTTASDALWAGCPLVGLTGETFAARVSGSVLAAAGVPELAADSLAGYEALALALARDRPRRDALRTQLADARDTAPLFDSEGFTRALEALYGVMGDG